MNKLTNQKQFWFLLSGGKKLVFSLARALLSVSQDATRAVNLLYCRSPSRILRVNSVGQIRVHKYVHSLCISQFQAPTSPLPGKLLEVVGSPAPGQKFSAKAQPPGQNSIYPRTYFRKSSKHCLLISSKFQSFTESKP